MKIVYAFRRVAVHPHTGGLGLPEGSMRAAFIKKSKEIGFDGLELGEEGETEKEVRDLRKTLDDAGLPCLAVRSGGILIHARHARGNRDRLERTLKYASWIGSPVANTSIGMPRPYPEGPGNFVGDPVSQGSSRDGREEDFERAARDLRDVAPMASDLGLKISIEVHQHGLVDNSWSGIHLMELVDHPVVGLNPDLGNIYWVYDVPEESTEDAIQTLAPRSLYWHCKNLRRTHIPELNKSIFHQLPLPEGDIDYRFAITAMVRAGYPGNIAIEGIRQWDPFYRDGKSVSYVREIMKELEQ